MTGTLHKEDDGLTVFIFVLVSDQRNTIRIKPIVSTRPATNPENNLYLYSISHFVHLHLDKLPYALRTILNKLV